VKDNERGYQADKTGIILGEFPFKDLFLPACRQVNAPNCCAKTTLKSSKS
jgi:hypothetical protein